MASGAGCCSVLGEKVRRSKGVLEGGRVAMDALPGQGQRQRGLSPRGSGLKLKEPNFP